MTRLWTTSLATGLILSACATSWAQDDDDRDGRRRGFRRPPNPVLAALDADDDGELSADEIKNAAAALKKLDENGDGKISRDEMPRPRFGFRGRGPGGRGPRGRGPGGPGGFAERFKEWDENGDGKVTRAELPERAQRILQFADTNGDDAIDEDEVEKMVERFRNRFRRRGDGEGRPRRGRPGEGRPRRPERPSRPERPEL